MRLLPQIDPGTADFIIVIVSAKTLTVSSRLKTVTKVLLSSSKWFYREIPFNPVSDSNRLQSEWEYVNTFLLNKSVKQISFSFYNSADPTHGMVNYVDANEAFASHLAYVREDNVTIIAVDNETKLNPGEYRKSLVNLLLTMFPPFP